MTYSWFLACGQSQEQEPKVITNLLNSVGGKEVWSRARGFRMLEIAHYANLKHPLIREYWVDFKQPRIKELTRSIERRQVQALNINKGWTNKYDGKIAVWDAKRLSGWQSFWPGIPTRIFHLIASKDPSLTYQVHEDKIDFYIDGNFAVWIATDESGNPVAYGRSMNHKETHFLGEMLNYNSVRLWKEAFEPGGQWNVEMVDYQLLDDLSFISFETKD